MQTLTFDEGSRQSAKSWGERLFTGVLSRLEEGHLRLALPSGGVMVARGKQTTVPEAQMQINRWRAVRRMLMDGDLGFADGYIENDWTSNDLPALIELAARNRAAIGKTIRPSVIGLAMARLLHAMRPNTRAGSRRNIVAHYDLGNDFYGAWLDRGMSYSSALYQTEHQSLEDAQTNKQDRIIELMRAPLSAKVLEIGCGWGGLAERMVQRGMQVTGLTLSPSQLAYAQSRLPGQANLRLQDYRDAEGSYDSIVSIEMLEAVGERFWPVYFARLKKMLAPGGTVVLQAITIADELFGGYRKDVDFIQRSIFPGGMLLTCGLIERHLNEAGLVLKSAEHFGQSYARTLSEWRQRFLDAWPAIEAMGFPPRFKRLWEYYLAYCEGGFRANSIDVGLYCAEHA